jgi:hypothetical protein
VKVRAAQATTIVLFALVMGVFWGTWFSLSRTMHQLSAETFLAVGHQMIHNLGLPMAILLPLALLSALVSLALLWPAGRTAAWWWMAAGLLLMVAALVITLAVEVPIDQQIQDWTVAALPRDWRSIQARWEAGQAREPDGYPDRLGCRLQRGTEGVPSGLWVVEWCVQGCGSRRRSARGWNGK